MIARTTVQHMTGDEIIYPDIQIYIQQFYKEMGSNVADDEELYSDSKDFTFFTTSTHWEN